MFETDLDKSADNVRSDGIAASRTHQRVTPLDVWGDSLRFNQVGSRSRTEADRSPARFQLHNPGDEQMGNKVGVRQAAAGPSMAHDRAQPAGRRR